MRAASDITPRPVLLPGSGSSAGGTTLVTRTWYDAKAPRTIRLDSGSATWVARARWLALGGSVAIVAVALAAPLWLIPVAFALAQLRRAGRAAATEWLDRAARQAGNQASAG